MCPILKTCFESTRPPQNPSKYQNIPDPRILSSPHYSLSCRQKGSGSRLRLHFGVRRHLALLVHYSVLDRVQKPHAEPRRVAGVRRPLLRALQPPHAPTPHLLVALGYLAVLSVEPQGGM